MLPHNKLIYNKTMQEGVKAQKKELLILQWNEKTYIVVICNLKVIATATRVTKAKILAPNTICKIEEIAEARVTKIEALIPNFMNKNQQLQNPYIDATEAKQQTLLEDRETIQLKRKI